MSCVVDVEWGEVDVSVLDDFGKLCWGLFFIFGVFYIFRIVFYNGNVLS